MSSSLVWLDSRTAKIFELSGDAVTIHVQHRRELENCPKNTLKADSEVDHFFHEVAERLTAVDGFVLVGPGEAKHQFVHHLERHRHPDLARHLLTVDSSDHPTDEQLVAQGRRFFADRAAGRLRGL